LAQHYTSFYNIIRASTAREENSQTEYDLQNNEEYQLFLLNQTLRKIERYAKLRPGVVTFFNKKLEEILESARSVVQQSIHTSPKIYNPSIVKTKGRVSKRAATRRQAEISGSQKCTIVCGSCRQTGHTRRSKNCPKNTQKRKHSELHSDNMTDHTDDEESEDNYVEELQEDESESEIESDNNGKNLVIIIFDLLLCIFRRLSFFPNQDVQAYEPCPYCEEPLPSPLPPKFEQYLSRLRKRSKLLKLKIFKFF